MKLYGIKDWTKHYEVSDSKKVDGPLSWVAVRTKQDGFGFRRIVVERDRCELFSAWMLMVQIAARQPRQYRGKLVRDGRPLNAKALATMTGFPEGVFNRAFEFFSDPEMDWLTVEALPSRPANTAATTQVEGAPVVPATTPPASDSVRTAPDQSGQGGSTLQDITGQDSDSSAPHAAHEPEEPKDPIVFVFPTVGDDKVWHLRQSKVAEYRQTFPALDVEGEIRAARQWCVDNAAKRKTARGMTKFLFGWLERSQNKGGFQFNATNSTGNSRSFKLSGHYPDDFEKG